MKKILIGLTLLASTTSFATIHVVKYANGDGCFVEKEQRRNGVVLYVTKGDEHEVVGYGNDYSFGDFAGYCAHDKTDVHFFEGSLGTDLMVSCSGHENGHATTRGRVDIGIMDGELSKVKIDGQVQNILGWWKQDVKIECLNLVKVTEQL